VLKVNLVIIAIESPLLIGIYENNILIDKVESDGQTSESLPMEFQKLLEKFEIENILFANGPGSFMAIKINYVFLKTISTVLNIKLLSQDGFFFNSNTPIRAINKMYFVKKEHKIEIEKVIDFQKTAFALPQKFEIEKYSEIIEPNYILPFL